MDRDTVYADVFAVFDALKAKGWQGFGHTEPSFNVIEMSNSRIVASPMPMSPLFRGENMFHKECKPSLYRREWTVLERLERELLLADFSKMLDVHPEVKALKAGNLEVNYTGLAQHYGIETDVLDLTNSPLVAAFFATTEYNAISDSYRPILHYVSQGVIYFFSMGCFSNFFEEPKIVPIGQEALRRPGEQRGFCIKMEKDENLNDLCYGIPFRFWHNPDASMKIWQMTRGGSLFFPFDPMAEKVRAMRKYRIFSKKSLAEVYEKRDYSFTSLEEMREKLEEHGCTFVDELPFAYTAKEVEYLEKEHKRMYPNECTAKL